MKMMMVFVFSLFASLAPLEAEAQFLENVQALKDVYKGSGNVKADEFLAAVEDRCHILSAKHDGTYYRGLGGQATASLSPFSAQSRLCATVIHQYDPRENPMGTKMKTCRKFKEPVRSCCETFEAGYTDYDLKGIAEELCVGVPSHLELMRVRNKADAEQDVKSRFNLMASCTVQ